MPLIRAYECALVIEMMRFGETTPGHISLNWIDVHAIAGRQ